jgi:DNA-binding PadR family transcriptional regulator
MTDLAPGTSELLILKMLTPGRMFAQDVAQHFRQIAREESHISEDSLYQALHRLQSRECILADWGSSEKNRNAKFYELTSAGWNQLEADIETWDRVSTEVNSVLGIDPEPTPWSRNS